MNIKIAASVVMLLFLLSACNLREIQISTLKTAQVIATQSGDAEGIPSDVPTDLPATLTEVMPTVAPSTAPQPSVFPSVEPTATAVPARSLHLTHIEMLDTTRGWGMDEIGRLLITRDGGNAWQDISPPQGVFNWRGFFALDIRNAWLVETQEADCSDAACTEFSGQISVWRTSDAGNSWQKSQPICLAGECDTPYHAEAEFAMPIQVQFLNQRTGWVLLTVQRTEEQDQYRIFRTDDGGSTWAFVSDTAKAPQIYRITGLAFLDETNGWLAANPLGSAETPSTHWTMYYTLDAGKNWKVFHLPTPKILPDAFSTTPYTCGVTGLQASPPSALDVDVDCRLAAAETEHTFPFHFHSITNGENWVSWLETGEVDFVSPSWAWRTQVDDTGVYDLERSTNAGAHWQRVASLPWNGLINFANELNGWALVQEGEASGFYRTVDGGLTWDAMEPILTQDNSPDVSNQPHEVILSADTGETFPGVYYPPSTSPAPAVILMHQVNEDLHQWDAIARWLWQEDVSEYRDENNPWLNSSWFPENTLKEKPAVLVFTYRDCGDGCVRPENKKILDDARTAIKYILELPEIDSQRITVIGTSVGADAALDSCFLQQNQTDFNCRNVFSFSPGSYLDYNFDSAAKVMMNQGTNVYCFAARADVIPADLCYNSGTSSFYHSYVGKGMQHGIELFSPDYEVNVLEEILQALQE